MQQQPSTSGSAATGGPKKFEKKVVVKKAANIKGFEDADFSEQTSSPTKPEIPSNPKPAQAIPTANIAKTNPIAVEAKPIPPKDTPKKVEPEPAQSEPNLAEKSSPNSRPKAAQVTQVTTKSLPEEQHVEEPVQETVAQDKPASSKVLGQRPAPPSKRPAAAPPAPRPKPAVIPRTVEHKREVHEAEPETQPVTQEGYGEDPEEHIPVTQQALKTRTQSAHHQTLSYRPDLQTQRTKSTGAPPSPTHPPAQRGVALLEQLPVQPDRVSQVLSECLGAMTASKPHLALAQHLLSSELPREKLLETPLEHLFELTSYDSQSDAWFVYYFTQFSLYRGGESEFYETWEQVLMAFLNKDNKISFLNGKTQNMVPQLSSERFVPINPTRMLLQMLEGRFTGTDQEYLVFLLALAKGLFHPEVADELVEIYLSETEDAVEPAVFDARMSAVFILQPSSLAREYLRDKVCQKIVSGQHDEFILIAEYAVQLALLGQKSTLASGLWVFLAITEALLNQGHIRGPEEYIRAITAKRAASGLTDSDSFSREFKRVRQLYYDSLERKGSDSTSASSFNLNGTNAIAQINQIGQQVFGMFKGVLSAGNKQSGGQGTNAPEEVKWDPVSKRWLINGQIPDNEPEPEVKAPAPPPPKRLPPATIKKEADEQGGPAPQKKPTAAGGKPKFVAYDFGNHKK